MASYLLLLRDQPEDFEGLGPDEMEGIIQKYVDWREQLEASGKLVGSDKLKDGDGRVMRRQDGKVRVTDGPFAETKEVVGGYFIIRAYSYDDAVACCQDHPHLQYGRSIELREIDDF